jgi:hypothetical protein
MNTRTQTTVQDLLDVATGTDLERGDYRSLSHQMFVDQDGGLTTRRPTEIVFGGDPAPLALTPWATGQIASKLDISYGRAFLTNNPIPPDIKADILNHFLQLRDEKEMLVRTYDDAVRGVLSDKYLIMDHTWVLSMVKTFLTDPSTEQVRSHVVAPGWRLEPDYMHFKIVLHTQELDGGSDGVYGLGVGIRNGTVGNASCGVSSLMMRTSCLNSLTRRKTDWTVRHVGSTDLLALRESLLIGAVAEAFGESKDLANALIRSRQQRLPNVFDVINQVIEGQKLPQDITNLVVSGTEQQENLFGLINGLTYAAHRADELDADQSEDLEAFAGSLLTEFGDGATEGDALARQLFTRAGSKAHVLVGDE